MHKLKPGSVIYHLNFSPVYIPLPFVLSIIHFFQNNFFSIDIFKFFFNTHFKQIAFVSRH